MKIVLTCEELRKGLAKVGKIASAKSAIPDLNCVRMTVDAEGNVRIASYDLTVGIISKHRASEYEQGGTLIPAKQLYAFAKSVGDGNITISDEDSKASISCGGYSFEITTLPVSGFPKMAIEEESFGTSPAKVKGKELLHLFASSYASAKDSTRPVLCGLSLKPDGDRLRSASTDGHRLATASVGCNVGSLKESGIIVPKAWVDFASKAIAESTDEDIEICMTDTAMGIRTSDTVIISNLFDGEFPDYESLLEEKETVAHSMRIIRIDMEHAMKVACSMTSDKAVTLTARPDGNVELVFVNSDSSGNGLFRYEDVKDGSSMHLTCNPVYVLDALSSLDSRTVILSQNSETEPIFITTEDEDDSVHLIMPMRR